MGKKACRKDTVRGWEMSKEALRQRKEYVTFINRRKQERRYRLLARKRNGGTYD